MKTIVFVAQCLLVFGIPTMFGWILLRRIFREVSSYALLPGAWIVGQVALMAGMNELRFICEMRQAAWFAYQALIALALLLLVLPGRRAPRARWPAVGRRPWQILLWVAANLAVACYFGVPALRGYLADAWWYHYPAAIQIQDAGRFPLNHVFALDSPLFYHYGPDILAATWSFLLDIPVSLAWGWYVTLFAPAVFSLGFALLIRLCRSYWGSLLGATILTAGGNLLFLGLPFADASSPLKLLTVFNSQTVQSLLQMMFTPSQSLGLALTLLVLLALRHAAARPGWALNATLGVLIGALSLVAEWYYLPLALATSAALALCSWRRRPFRALAPAAAVPLAVALLCGVFNNSYVAGLTGHYWMRYDQPETLAEVRQVNRLIADYNEAPVLLEQQDLLIRSKWGVPDLVPLRLKLAHFGWVPSWEAAASKDGSSVFLLSPRFLAEAFPVLLLGIPFGCWLAWRSRQPVVWTLAGLAILCALPPIFLDWGYRSTDFLRFFTAAYAFAALFIGWLIGDLFRRGRIRSRVAGLALAAACLITPVGVGIIGLLPGTLSAAKEIAVTARSLSEVAATQGTPEAAEAAQKEQRRQQALETLALSAGEFLYPYTKGRDRALVLVPAEQIPATTYFPEWMKLATLSRLPIPVGWHWQESIYSAHYRRAALELDAKAIAALDVKWVILSNVFMNQLPETITQGLADRGRFVPVRRFREGEFYLTVFRIRAASDR